MKGKFLESRFLFLIAGLLAADQYTKHLITEHMLKYQSIVIWPDFFSLTYVENTGAAFGILADLDPSYRVFFFLGISFIALGAVIFLYRSFSPENKLARTAAILIVAGAIGNMIDRVRFGVVVDFLDFHWYQYHWPAFNIADSAITLGVGALLVDAFLETRRTKTPSE